METLEILESTNGEQIGYEINISCPNVKQGGMEFGVSCDMTENLTREVRKMTDKLVIMKLGPKFSLFMVSRQVTFKIFSNHGGYISYHNVNNTSSVSENA